MLRTHSFRSDLRPISTRLSSGGAIWTNTKEASPTELRVPTPMLIFDLKSTGLATFAGSMRAQPVNPPSHRPPSQTGQFAEKATASLVEDTPSEAVATEVASPDSGKMAEIAGSEPEATAETAGRIDRRPLPTPEPEPISQPNSDEHKFEMTIDSLPHLQLLTPFPVMIEALGEKLFTATIPALRLSGTGDTLTDALITVKEQTETQYERLMKLTGLDDDEASQLRYLQSHIKSPTEPAKHKRGIWR